MNTFNELANDVFNYGLKVGDRYDGYSTYLVIMEMKNDRVTVNFYNTYDNYILWTADWTVDSFHDSLRIHGFVPKDYGIVRRNVFKV